MSFLFRRSEQPAAKDRSMVFPPVVSQYLTETFASVNAAQGDTSLQSIALRSTADLIASLVSELPANVYRNDKLIPGATPANIDDPGGDGSGREDWLYCFMMSALLRGNVYGFETSWHGRTATPLTFELLHPDEVTVTDAQPGSVNWYHLGKKLEGQNLDAFKHWRVNPVPGRILGLSPVAVHATTIGISLRSAKFGDQWFADGAHPSGMLVNQANLTDLDAEKAKRRLVDSMRGSRDPLVLGNGWKYDAIQVNPEESQFLQTQKYTEAQCARMFGPGFAEIMGYETGSSMTYANVVDRRQDLLVFSMNRWIRRADRILTAMLPPSTMTVRLNRDALLEATTLQRFQAHRLALEDGWRTINEVRNIEDLQPVPWGNEPFIKLKPPTQPDGAQP